MILCIIQARMGSNRLPEKVLKPILGRPMLGRMLDRLKRAKLIDEIAIATSLTPADNAIEAFCESEDIRCFRGSEDNVLERFAGCAALFSNADHIIRVTGDCPLIDPTLMDSFIESYLQLLPNIDHYHLGAPNYPRGLDAEIFPKNVLEITAQNAINDYELEHVTPYIYRNPDRFISKTFTSGEDHSDQRWCVDEEDDFKLVEAIFEMLHPTNPNFTWLDVLQLLDAQPELKQINAHVLQKNT